MRPLAALADGPVADDPEPVAAQAVVACPDTHRHHMDAVRYAHGDTAKSPGAV